MSMIRGRFEMNERLPDMNSYYVSLDTNTSASQKKFQYTSTVNQIDLHYTCKFTSF